jgi:hypothetical protein
MILKTCLLKPNQLEEISQNPFPAILRTWQNHPLELAATGTHFGYVYQGDPHLYRPVDQATYPLYPKMYFGLPGEGRIDGSDSAGIVITLLQYQGMFSLGGPIEAKGRFAYIDGGTSSLLVPPIMLGDPCLNAMYFPPGIDQTLHTHPSYRIGIVVSGAGELKTDHDVRHLEPGMIFLIPADHLHKFCTVSSPLTVVVFHPDSDIGFTHQNNPMLKRTIVDGISATELPQIHTKLA